MPAIKTEIAIYHNPRCQKSRQALQLLTDAGANVRIVEYLKTPLTAGELDALCEKLDVEPQSLIRYKEALAAEIGVSATDSRRRAEWLEILAAHPQLLERPIAVRGRKARLGRPPEAVLELL